MTTKSEIRKTAAVELFPLSPRLPLAHQMGEGYGVRAREWVWERAGVRGASTGLRRARQELLTTDCGLLTSQSAFTLIEMLVVIAIIGLLASLIFPVGAAVNKAKIRSSAKAQMEQIATAIEEYKSKLGYYPPDNPIPNGSGVNYGLNQLYYELEGTILLTNANSYQTINGATTIPVANLVSAFGSSKVQSFLNTTKNPGSDDVQSAINFMKNLKGGQFLQVTAPPGTAPLTVLGTSITGPVMYTDASGRKINPWYYNSTNPTNNTSSYDLWTDVLVGQKTNRICNWSSRPLTF